MLHRLSIVFSCLLFSSFLFSNNHHEKFLLPHPPSWRFHDNEPIRFKSQLFQQLITKWQNRLEKSWEKITTALALEIGITIAEADEILKNNSFVKLYMSKKNNELKQAKSMCIDEKDVDPEVLHFIKRTLQKYCSKKNIKIILTPYISMLSSTYGSDEDTHYVFCLSTVYSSENIKHYYDALQSNNGLFYPEPLPSKKDVRFIEISNLLLVGLIEAASHIQHQSNIFSYLISYLFFSNNIEKERAIPIITLCLKYTEMRGMLESILQSKNPLETALFVAKSGKKTRHDKKNWIELIKDISECYHPQSLAKLKRIMREIKDFYKV